MRTAIQIASSSAKFTAGVAFTTVFVATCDDVIYSNFRKNVIMPVQMVTVRSPAVGNVNAEDIKEVAQGTKNFINEMRPHAITPSSAKELMLKDAEYSTPQDHYFGYTQRDRSVLDSGLSMNELRQQKKSEEMAIISDLYDDQQGRAESIERHIDYLEQKRAPKTMTEVFQGLTDAEKKDIERNWGTTLEELKALAETHDAKAAADAVLPEDWRNKQQDQMLANVNMNKIMDMAVGDAQAVEYTDSESQGLTIPKEQLVKIAPKKKGKKKRRLTADQQAEYQRELQAILIAQQQEEPGKDQEQIQKAVQMAKESRLQAREVSDKDMENLNRLRKRAIEKELVTSDSQSASGAVKISNVVSSENVQ